MGVTKQPVPLAFWELCGDQGTGCPWSRCALGPAEKSDWPDVSNRFMSQERSGLRSLTDHLWQPERAPGGALSRERQALRPWLEVAQEPHCCLGLPAQPEAEPRLLCGVQKVRPLFSSN